MFLSGLILAGFGAQFLGQRIESTVEPTPANLTPALPLLTLQKMRRELADLFPLKTPIARNLHFRQYDILTSLDHDLQGKVTSYIKRRRPIYAAVAAIEPKTGAVLCLVSYTRDRRYRKKNLALLAPFPAASVFKLVTSAAVISEGTRGRTSTIPFTGSKTAPPNRWNMKTSVSYRSHWTTLEDAFATSNNPVFGKLGLFDIGGPRLVYWAKRFGWNEAITPEIHLQQSQLQAAEGPFSWAKTGSGYTTTTTLSPVHAAAIAASMVNDGIMPSPTVIRSMTDNYQRLRYTANSWEGNRVVTKEVARELRSMMRSTLMEGTAKGAFLYRNQVIRGLDIGGKTGTLTGETPPGRAEWFMGWAKRQETGKQLAFSALVLHGSRERANPQRLARYLLTLYFAED